MTEGGGVFGYLHFDLFVFRVLEEELHSRLAIVRRAFQLGELVPPKDFLHSRGRVGE